MNVDYNPLRRKMQLNVILKGTEENAILKEADLQWKTSSPLSIPSTFFAAKCLIQINYFK